MDKSFKGKAYIMTSEPIPDCTPADIRDWLKTHTVHQALAFAFAMVSNKFFWVADNEYDYPYGSKQHAWVCEITDAWGTLMDELEERIYLILSERGVTIPKTRKIDVLRPFMKEFGFIDGRGWWIKPQNASDNTTQNESMDS